MNSATLDNATLTRVLAQLLLGKQTNSEYTSYHNNECGGPPTCLVVVLVETGTDMPHLSTGEPSSGKLPQSQPPLPELWPVL